MHWHSYVASPQTPLWEGFLLSGNFSSFNIPSPGQGFLPNSFVSLFVFYILSFRRERAAFLDAWGPPSVFRSCFVEVAQHSNDLLMNLWGRKWSPCPIPLPSCLFSNYDFLVTWLFSNYEILNYILLKESNTAILVTRIASTAFFPWLLLAAGVLPSEVSFL